MEPLVLNSISKAYHGFRGPWSRMLCAMSFGYLGVNLRKEALSNISFSANHGEAIGIIGENGAGKSTLLKLIAGVLVPDKGELKIKGNVRALLDLGLGFNPELTAKQNTNYNGMIWGYSKSELESMLPDIFSFSELEGLENTPLKEFSSGMVMRLGFSLAVAQRPDILIVDEALVVGDARFQQKCLSRVSSFLNEGTVLLFVSHDLNLLSHFCKRSILIHKGKILLDSNTRNAIEQYMQVIAGSHENAVQKFKELNEFQISFSKNGLPRGTILRSNEDIELLVQFSPASDWKDLTVGFHIDDARGIRVFGTNTLLLGLEMGTVLQGQKRSLQFRFPLHIGPGKYSIGVAFHKGRAHTEGNYFWGESLFSFEIDSGGKPDSIGLLSIPVEARILD